MSRCEGTMRPDIRVRVAFTMAPAADVLSVAGELREAVLVTGEDHD